MSEHNLSDEQRRTKDLNLVFFQECAREAAGGLRLVLESNPDRLDPETFDAARRGAIELLDRVAASAQEMDAFYVAVGNFMLQAPELAANLYQGAVESQKRKALLEAFGAAKTPKRVM